MQNKWRRVKSGTDIRGIAIENDENLEVTLTKDMVNIFSSSFCKWLSKKINKKQEELTISVGMDSRLSGPEFKNAVISGLCDMGCTVFDCNMASTPSMFMSIVLDEFKCDGAIMLTASHLPYMYNGMKFFTKDGGVESEEVSEIISIAESKDFEYSPVRGRVENKDLISVYSSVLRQKIIQGMGKYANDSQPLKGFKIIVDAGNGAGGFYATKVLKKLGADIEGSQFIEPDGRFPNHIPNPEKKEAMDSIKEAVIKNKADLGIIFDADVDRAAIVDSNGLEINRNSLIALISAIILEEHPYSIIVTDSVTSTGLTDFIEGKLKGVHHRFKRGYKNVINEAIRLNNEGKECHLAIETSGHAAIKENYFLDDGAYLVSKIIIKAAILKAQGKTIQQLIKNLKRPCESKEYRFKIKCEDFRRYGNKVIDEMWHFVKDETEWNVVPNNYEGIRVSCGKNKGQGWYLLRMSLHEPVMPLNIESDVEGGVEYIASHLIPFFKRYSDLDSSSLEKEV